jgi:hypothetical protein
MEKLAASIDRLAQAIERLAMRPGAGSWTPPSGANGGTIVVTIGAGGPGSGCGGFTETGGAGGSGGRA